MDVEYDSNYEQLSDLEINEESGIQPYKFEPTRTTEESSDDGYSRPQRHIRAAAMDIPEVSIL